MNFMIITAMQAALSAKYIIVGIIAFLALSACNTSKFLEDGEYLLEGNTIVLNKSGSVDRKRSLGYELSTLYRQTKNNNFFFIPREWFYFKLQDAKDTTKFDNWQRRVIAEEPVIFDDSTALKTANNMRRLLQQKGYFDAEVTYDKDQKPYKRQNKGTIKITYNVTPNRQYTVDSIRFYSEDQAIDSILQAISKRSILKSGAAVDKALYERERERITRYLRNHGYAYFYKNFIGPLEAEDTTHNGNYAKLALEVLLPPEDSIHRVYRVRDIEVYMDYTPGQEDSVLVDTVIGNILMHSPHQSFRIKPNTILQSIYLKEGEVYSQSDFDKTNKQLAGLGVFRFVRIKQEADPLYPDQLNFRIELTQSKRMEFGGDVELNYASRSATGIGNLIGLSVSPSYRNRNLFKGAELLITEFNAGVEFNPAPSAIANRQFWNTVDLGVQTDLYLPRYIDYLKIARRLNQAKYKGKSVFLEDEGYNKLKDNASARISANFNYLLILDFYEYYLFTGTYGFDYQPATNKRLILNHLGIDYLFPQTAPNFDDLLTFNPFLERSFGEQLFVSFLFRDLNYVFNSRPNRRGNSYYFGFNLELAGAEIWAGNALYNSFALEPDTLRLNLRDDKQVDFSQYVRTQVDFRRYWQLAPNQSVAARFNLGIARPFGYTSDVPYVKQFFAGGPNSIRAWAPRGLGPGAYEDTLAVRSTNNTRLYQTGDLKLEFNLEYRFKIFWLLNGAFFLDAGNVWTLRRDPNRCGSQFLFSEKVYNCVDQVSGGDISYTNEPFYKQIAVGGGFGLRMDFSYFILRLDMGVKLRHAAPFPDIPADANNWRNYWFRDFRPDGNRVDLNFTDVVAFNLGFGYPF
jgi:outer membrane protein assembly factor BamA